jgi:hypothetical protein
MRDQMRDHTKPSATKDIINAILYDSSSPIKAVPKVLYHAEGLLINNTGDYVNVRRFETT